MLKVFREMRKCCLCILWCNSGWSADKARLWHQSRTQSSDHSPTHPSVTCCLSLSFIHKQDRYTCSGGGGDKSLVWPILLPPTIPFIPPETLKKKRRDKEAGRQKHRDGLHSSSHFWALCIRWGVFFFRDLKAKCSFINNLCTMASHPCRCAGYKRFATTDQQMLHPVRDKTATCEVGKPETYEIIQCSRKEELQRLTCHRLDVRNERTVLCKHLNKSQTEKGSDKQLSNKKLVYVKIHLPVCVLWSCCSTHLLIPNRYATPPSCFLARIRLYLTVTLLGVSPGNLAAPWMATRAWCAAAELRCHGDGYDGCCCWAERALRARPSSLHSDWSPAAVRVEYVALVTGKACWKGAAVRNWPYPMVPAVAGFHWP